MPYKSKHSKYINKIVKWAKEVKQITVVFTTGQVDRYMPCLLYTSDAADE